MTTRASNFFFMHSSFLSGGTRQPRRVDQRSHRSNHRHEAYHSIAVFIATFFANFRERRACELRRISLPRTPVNSIRSALPLCPALGSFLRLRPEFPNGLPLHLGELGEGLPHIAVEFRVVLNGLDPALEGFLYGLLGVPATLRLRDRMIQ